MVVQTINCPANDHGTCTIPDKTALVEDGAVSLVKRSAVLRRIRRDRRRRKRAPEGAAAGGGGGSTAELDVVFEAEGLRPIDLPQDWQMRLDEPEVAQTIVKAAQQTPGRSTVVACTCGHTYIVDL
jgi:hypothetical protein